MLDIGTEIRGRKIRMAITVTQINYSDIDQTILRECFDDSLPYLDAEKPNIIWEDFSLTKDNTDDEKFEALRAKFETSPIVFKTELDGRIVSYAEGGREIQGTGMFCHMIDLMRKDANGSRSWSYTQGTEYSQALDTFYKSISDNNAQSSLWVVEGSSMEASNDDAVTQGCLTYTTQETVTHHGYTYKKLVITIIV